MENRGENNYRMRIINFGIFQNSLINLKRVHTDEKFSLFFKQSTIKLKIEGETKLFLRPGGENFIADYTRYTRTNQGVIFLNRARGVVFIDLEIQNRNQGKIIRETRNF